MTNSGAITVIGDRGVGVRADSVSGDVRIRGAITVQGEGSVGVQVGPIDGQLLLQNAITATGYRSADRLTDAQRAKLDADDLKQGGSAVRITGDVGKGVRSTGRRWTAAPPTPTRTRTGSPIAWSRAPTSPPSGVRPPSTSAEPHRSPWARWGPATTASAS